MGSLRSCEYPVSQHFIYWLSLSESVIILVSTRWWFSNSSISCRFISWHSFIESSFPRLLKLSVWTYRWFYFYFLIVHTQLLYWFYFCRMIKHLFIYSTSEDIFFLLLLVREEGERETSMWERNIYLLPVIGSLTGHWTRSLGSCPDRESKLRPFSVWDDASTHWATYTRATFTFLNWTTIFFYLSYILVVIWENIWSWKEENVQLYDNLIYTLKLKLDLQLWVCKTQSWFLRYLSIIVLCICTATVDLLLPTPVYTYI